MSGLIKIHKKINLRVSNKHFSLKPFFSLAPAFLGFITISLFGLIFLTTPQKNASAGPTPPPTPTLSTSISSPTVNFQFSQSELSASAFKDSPVYLTVDTNSETGATSYISSIDEDTNLNHTDPAVTEKISSITSPMLSSAFAQKSWGYHVIDGLNNTFKPVPKASTPDTISVTNSPSGSPYSIGIDFGVKSSPDLPSGNYSKQILFTTITNRVPTKATFKAGSDFNSIIKSLNSAHDTDYFKHSDTPPANLATATIISTTDSERPIYTWYNSADKTIYWWSDADIAYANDDSSYMFSGISPYNDQVMSLVDLRGINFSKTKNMNNMFSSSKTGCIEKINFDGFDTSDVEDMSSMFESYCPNVDVSTLNFDVNVSHFNTGKVKNMQNMFAGSPFESLDLSRWDTKNVTNMLGMFLGTSILNSLDVSHFNTSNVTDMSYMFFRMFKLNALDLSSFDTSNVTNMSSMFAENKNLTSLNVSSFNTSNVTDMSNMFASTGKLSSLNLSHFDTSNVTNMKNMFGIYDIISLAQCNDTFSTERNLTNLDLSSFNTSKVTDMSNMFTGQYAITSLNLSSFNTSKVTDMSYMFCGMRKLQNLNLSSFNTLYVTRMDNMFEQAMVDPINSVLDLSSFNTPSLYSVRGMFSGSKIKTIYASTHFDVSHVIDSIQLFNDNTNLVGGNGTAFSPSNPTDKTYARIDAPGTPGYFTKKP